MIFFFSEIVNVFQQFTIFAKKLRYCYWTFDIFPTIFTAALLDCLKQTYQIFRADTFQDVSEDDSF